MSASFWVTCSHLRTSELKPSRNRRFPTSLYEHRPRRAALFVHKGRAQAASATTKALQDLGTFKPAVEPRCINSARASRDPFSESKTKLWLSAGVQRCVACAVVWADMRLKPFFGMSFITHIFHMLMRVGSCPAGLLRFTRLPGGESWRTASRPQSETNKQETTDLCHHSENDGGESTNTSTLTAVWLSSRPLRWNRCVSTLIRRLNICLQEKKKKKTSVRNFWFVCYIPPHDFLNSVTSLASLRERLSDRDVLACARVITSRALRSASPPLVCLRLCLPVRLSCAGLWPVLVGGGSVGRRWAGEVGLKALSTHHHSWLLLWMVGILG